MGKIKIMATNFFSNLMKFMLSFCISTFKNCNFLQIFKKEICKDVLVYFSVSSSKLHHQYSYLTILPLEFSRCKTTRRFVGHNNDVLSVAFSADNRQIVSGSRDKSIKLWNTLGVCKYTIQVLANVEIFRSALKKM